MKKGLIQKSRVLVTGGAGFIGSNLCEALLDQGNEVVCLDNLSTGLRQNIAEFESHPKFTFIEGDIRDLEVCKEAVQGADHVLHQAALGSIPRSIDDPLSTNSVNVNGFLNMLFACKEAGIKRFVFASSSSTYGDSVELPKNEDKIGQPLSPYAVSKLINELYSKVFTDIYGIETIGLRYFNVFGARQNPEGAYAAAIPKFIRAFLRGESPVIFGDGHQSRDFTYVDNVVQANQLAATCKNKNISNTIFNVACGASIPLNDLVALLQQLLAGFDPRIKDIAIRYEAPRTGDIRHSLASIDKARQLLGYNPGYDVKRGLELAIEWYWDNLK